MTETTAKTAREAQDEKKLDRRRTRRFSQYVDVEVEIEPDDLIEAGWHHEDDCLAPPPPDPVAELFDVAGTIGSLHHQAHPSQHPDPFLCREEPCRSLPVDAWRLR